MKSWSAVFLVSTSRVHGASSEGLQTIHVLKDITDRREVERRYRELFDNIQEGLFFSTPDGRFVEVNDALVAHSSGMTAARTSCKWTFAAKCTFPMPGTRRSSRSWKSMGPCATMRTLCEGATARSAHVLINVGRGARPSGTHRTTPGRHARHQRSQEFPGGAAERARFF